MADEKPLIEWGVKKGKRLLIEIEFTKDFDLYADRSILLEALYSDKLRNEGGINGEFIVQVIYHGDAATFLQNFKAKVEEAMSQIKL